MLHMTMLGIGHILSYMIVPIYYKTEGSFSFFTGKKIPAESKLLFVHQSAYQKSLKKSMAMVLPCSTQLIKLLSNQFRSSLSHLKQM